MDDVDRHRAILLLQKQVEDLGSVLQRFLLMLPEEGVPPLELARLQYALLQDALSLQLLAEQQIIRLRDLIKESRTPGQ